MARLEWDAAGTREYEMGVKNAVLYPKNAKTGEYEKGVAWNGLTAVTESPSGAEATKLYADNMVYAVLRGAEEYGVTVEGYTYPPEWEPCDGSAQIVPGVTVGQQTRQAFGLSWVTNVGNDVTEEAGEKIHIMWNATANPAERNYETVNNDPDAITFSWECEATPVSVAGLKPTAHMEINCAKLKPETVAAIQKKLYGDDSAGEPTLPTPDELIALIKTTETPE